jgi:hypothetical protein
MAIPFDFSSSHFQPQGSSDFSSGQSDHILNSITASSSTVPSLSSLTLPDGQFAWLPGSQVQPLQVQHEKLLLVSEQNSTIIGGKEWLNKIAAKEKAETLNWLGENNRYNFLLL